MTQTKRLNAEDFAMLYDALANVYAADSGESDRNGFHIELMATLNKLGVKVMSSSEAVRLAEEMLNA